MPALPKRIFVLGAATALAFALSIYFYLTKFPDPPGIDGYFYLKQILSLGRDREFYFKDYSLAFLLPALLRAVGAGELLALRAAVAATLGVFFWTQWILVTRLTAGLGTGAQRLALLLGSILTVINFPAYELAFGFLKTITALVFCVWAIVFIADSLAEGRGYWRALPFALLAMLSHKTSVVLLMIAGLAFMLQRLRIKTFAYVSTAALGAGLFFVLFFSQGWAYLGFLFAGFGFSPGAHWDWAVELIRQQNFAHLSVVGALVFLPSYFWLRPGLGSPLRFVGDFVFALGLVTWLPVFSPGEEQPAYRMMLIFATLTPPVIVALLLRQTRLQMPVGVLCGVLLSQFLLGRPVASLVPRYDQYSEEVMALENFVAPGDHMVCHHGLEFYVDYKTRIRCQIYLSENKEQKQFRLVYAPPEAAWEKVRTLAEPKAIAELDLDYFLLRESDWQDLVKKDRIKNHWRNPSEYRPGHIYAP